jgi:hypothetical protein
VRGDPGEVRSAPMDVGVPSQTTTSHVRHQIPC